MAFTLYLFFGIIFLQPLLKFTSITIDQVTNYGIILGYLIATILICGTSRFSLVSKFKMKERSPLLILSIVFMSISACILINEISAQFARMSSVFAKTDSIQTSGILAIIGILILAPICEELIFRGEIQNRIQFKYGNYVALLVASGLFSLFHLSIQKIPFTLMLGLLCGVVLLISGSVIFSILVHFIFNLFDVLPSSFGLVKILGQQAGGVGLIRFNLYAIIASLVIFIFTFWIFYLKNMEIKKNKS